jgi:hypothetical protein
VRGFSPRQEASQVELRNESTLAAILRLVEQGSKPLGVLNFACRSMVYTDGAIWSPDVVFFRDDSGALLPVPVKASVLTLPAVNYTLVSSPSSIQLAAR